MRDRSGAKREKKRKQKEKEGRREKESKNKLTSNSRWSPKLNDYQAKQNLKAPTTPKKGGCKRRVEREMEGRRR